MKLYLALGGALGFALAFFGSLLAGNGAVFALRDGAIGCLAGAMMLKGFRYVVVHAVRDHVARATSKPAPENRAAQVNGTH